MKRAFRGFYEIWDVIELGEIWDIIESVSGGFLTYSFKNLTWNVYVGWLVVFE